MVGQRGHVNAPDHPWKPHSDRLVQVMDAAHTAGLIDSLLGVESRAMKMKGGKVRVAYEEGYAKGQEDLGTPVYLNEGD